MQDMPSSGLPTVPTTKNFLGSKINNFLTELRVVSHFSHLPQFDVCCLGLHIGVLAVGDEDASLHPAAHLHQICSISVCLPLSNDLIGKDVDAVGSWCILQDVQSG